MDNETIEEVTDAMCGGVMGLHLMMCQRETA